MKSSWATRLAIALMLISCAMAYSFYVEPRISFPEYYFVVAAFDLAIMFALRLFGNNSVTRDMQLINLLSIANHTAGFVIYMLYAPPFYYNVALFCLKALEWLRLIMVMHDDNLPGNSFRIDLFRKSLAHRLQGFTKEATR